MLNLDRMPSKVEPKNEVKEGVNKLTIIDSKQIKTSGGCDAIQNTYKVNDSEFKINYDNCIITQKNGEDCIVGQVKLKRILEATGVAETLHGDFTLKMAANMLIGKSFMAPLVKGKPNAQGNSYLELSTKFDLYAPVEILNGPIEEAKIAEEAKVETELFNVDVDNSSW